MKIQKKIIHGKLLTGWLTRIRENGEGRKKGTVMRTTSHENKSH